MGNINFELSDQQFLLVCGQMSSLSFVQKNFSLGRGNGFGCRGKCGDWVTIAPT